MPTLAGLSLASILVSAALGSGSFAQAAPMRVSEKGVPNCDGRAQVRGYEVEPTLAADASGRLLAAAWQQDRARRPGLGAIANIVAISRDRGRSWQRRIVKGVSRCGGGPEAYASDPWASIGPEGTIYVSSLGNTPVGQHGGQRTIWAQSSADGGRKWTRRLVAGPSRLNDKETVTADPFVPGRAWLAWRGQAPSGGPHLISRTVDGGASWGAPVPMNTAAPRTFDLHVLPLAPSRLLAVYANPSSTTRGRFELESVTSTDGGLSWAEPRAFAAYTSRSLTSADGRPVRAYPEVIGAAAAPDGTAYVAIQRVGRRRSRIVVLISRDAGATWSRDLVAGVGGGAGVPVIAASASGAVAVTYLSFDRDRRGDREVTVRYRAAVSTDRGLTWKNRRLTRTFDARRAKSGGEIFLGDYTGLAPLGRTDRFAALITAGPPLARRGPTDVFFRPFGPDSQPGRRST